LAISHFSGKKRPPNGGLFSSHKDLCSQRIFCFLSNRSKRNCVMHSDVSKNATVNAYLSFFQARNHAAVLQTVLTCNRIDTCNPQSAELTFLLTTVTVCILTSFDYRLERYAVNA